jgi:hypothetical protein
MFTELLFVVDIPGFDDYSISECGRVYCWSKKNFISVFVNNDGYKRVHIKDNEGKDFNKRLHRPIAETYIPNQNNLPIVDHINHDILDNSLINLRWCNYIQSSQNKSKTKSKTSSKYRGVCWDKRYSKWLSQAMVNYKKKHLGYFDTENEAAIAYNNFITIHHGEYANPNIIVYEDEDILIL